MKSSNITDTEARLGNILVDLNNKVIEDTVPSKIEKAMKDVFIKTGRILRFYPYVDKALVEMDLTGEKEICKILHRYGGDLIEFYTPSSASGGYDTDVHEPFITPKASQNVCVLKIQDSDSIENLILGYYQNEEIVGFNPAKPGNVKMTSLLEDGDEYWVKFGKDGFQYKLPTAPSMQVGSRFNENGFDEVEYHNGSDVYTKEDIGRLMTQINNRLSVIEENLGITPPIKDTCDPNIPNSPNYDALEGTTGTDGTSTGTDGSTTANGNNGG